MEPALMLLLGMAALGVIVALVLLGRRASRYLERAAPHDLLNTGVGRAGRIVAGVVCAFGVLFAALAGVPPDTKLGAFIHEPIGTALGFAASMLIITIGAALYDRARRTNRPMAPPENSLERSRD